MRKFNLDRFNMAKIKLGEQPIKLKRTTYRKPRIKNNSLIGRDGKPTGTKGDMYTKIIMDKILQEGCLDHDPRPKYIDFYEGAKYLKDENVVVTKEGKRIELHPSETAKIVKDGVEIYVPAHTISVNNGVECMYDLSKGETPMITLRPIAMKQSTAEILWIYQQQSNDLVTFDELQGIRTWDDNKPLEENEIHNWWWQWAIRDDETGELILNEKGHPTIGKCYGGTTAPRDFLRKAVIEAIKTNPDSRRLIVDLWQVDDFKEKYGLNPCAYNTTWNVRHEWDGYDYLDMTLSQRSSDFATAGCINQVQYAELLLLVAKEVGMRPGVFTWKPVNVQLYDRHLDQAIEMLNRDPVDDVDATLKLSEDTKGFDEATVKDFKIFTPEEREKIKTKNPQFKFPLGV